MVPWAHPSPQPKQHLDQFSVLAGLTTVTDRQTMLLQGHIYVHSTAMLPRRWWWIR